MTRSVPRVFPVFGLFVGTVVMLAAPAFVQSDLERAYRITGRPILLGEFHIGVPANGLGAGLVQARDQTQRALGYRYYVEQAASLPAFVGAYWFEWRDEPVLGRFARLSRRRDHAARHPPAHRAGVEVAEEQAALQPLEKARQHPALMKSRTSPIAATARGSADRHGRRRPSRRRARGPNRFWSWSTTGAVNRRR